MRQCHNNQRGAQKISSDYSGTHGAARERSRQRKGREMDRVARSARSNWPNADLSRTTPEPLALSYSLWRTQGGAMERKRLDKEPEAETPLSHLRRASSMPASTIPPAQGPHPQEGISDPSPRRDSEHSAWTGASLADHLPARMM